MQNLVGVARELESRKVMEDLLKTHAPFLFNNWQWILFTTIFVSVITIIGRMFLGRKKHVPQKQAKNLSKNPQEESPMAEFQEFTMDNLVAPSLHSPDTPHIPYKGIQYTEEEMLKQSHEFYTFMNKRRSVRQFKADDVPLEVMNNIIKTAGTSPSGAHTEPWTFVVIKDKMTKGKIRDIIEQEEYLNYNHRMGEKWVTDLKFIRSDHQKAYLEEAPYLVIVFKQQYHTDSKGVNYAHYYYEVSTALASGILVAAIHNAGLTTVVTTPMNAGGQLRELLGRPPSEKVMLLLPVGYPADDCKVPDVGRKGLDEIMVVV